MTGPPVLAVTLALALLASPAARAVSVVYDFDFVWHLVDLDPNDGISPYLDTSLQTEDHEYESNYDGAVKIEASLTGRLTTTGPDGWASFHGFHFFQGSVLSPRTAFVHSGPALVGVSPMRPGEHGSAEVHLYALADTGLRSADSIAASGPTPDTSRVLSARIDNLSGQPMGITYGWGYSASVAANGVSPIPEPETYAMVLLGLPLVVAAARRRVRAARRTCAKP